jgi:hypothetical protein
MIKVIIIRICALNLGVNLDRQTIAAKLNFNPSDNTNDSSSINYMQGRIDLLMGMVVRMWIIL